MTPLPTNPHYESVRTKIISACPELMELERDCWVKYSKKGRWLPYRKQSTEYYCGQCREGSMSGQAFTSYHCGYCRKGFSHPNTGTPRYCEACARKNLKCQYCRCYFEIVGREPGLSHLLRTIEKIKSYIGVSSNGMFRVIDGDLYRDDKGNSVTWNLTKDDLAQQDPSVWEALDKMLSV